MVNILSYFAGTPFKGSEIKEWIRYHTENKTSKTREARRMTKYLNISDDGLYYLWKGDYQADARMYHVQRFTENRQGQGLRRGAGNGQK